MQSSQNYLIFDFGASNCRAIVAHFDGITFSMEVTYRFENRPVLVSGTLYWDILDLYSGLKNGILASLKKYPDIKSLAIDAWGADFGTIDKNGKLISNPTHYRDRKREEDSHDLLRIIPAEELYRLTGASVIPLFDLFHLFSLKKQGSPEILNAYRFLSIADIFNYFLTDKPGNEVTRLTTSVFYNQFEKKIETKILDLLELPKNIFPEVLKPGDKIASISKQVCRELGIKTMEVIAPATHDTASAEAGIPVKYPDRVWAFISIGTWCSLGVETESPVATKETFEAKFLNEAGVENINMFVKNINGLWIIQQCMEKWKREKSGAFDWPDIDKLYPYAEPFRSFINVEDPVFLPASINMPDVINKYLAETGQKKLESIGDFSRVFYESLVLRFRFHLTRIEKFINKKVEVYHIVGGGTNNKLFCQWISDAFGVQVIAGPVETTSVGNLLMQLKASGDITDIAQGRKISYDSSKLSFYEPKDCSVWDDAHGRCLDTVFKSI